MTVVLVLAKSPAAGRVKTRLCPPYTFEQAATIARASLEDTLDAVSGSRAGERVLVLDGPLRFSVPVGWRVVPQGRGDLGARLEAAFTGVSAPALLVGMDTPQLNPDDLDRALDALVDTACDAVLGPALDGGFWAIGFRRRFAAAFAGVPMSTSATCDAQHARLVAIGARVRVLQAMRDVDNHADAVAVADLAPETRLAVKVRELEAAGAR